MGGEVDGAVDGEVGAAIDLRNVVKRFYHYEHRTTTMQEFFARFLTRKSIHVRTAKFHLAGITLRIDPGESVALLGANGSGKSTLLRMMAGIYPPTTGEIVRRGRMVAIIELGSTFQPTLTGEENVRLYAAALGFTRAETEERLGQILDFAGLMEFRDVPLKYYSSGMQSRLAFSIASSAEPDVLLLDEILSVGDGEFRARCYARIHRFQAKGGTLVLASHDLDVIRDMCRRAVWLHHGEVRAIGGVQEVTAAYEAAMRAAFLTPAPPLALGS